MELRKGAALSLSKGYKQTEVGVIPNDWEVLPLDSVFNFYSTSNYSKAEMFLNGDIGCIHYGLIHAIPNSSYNLQNGIKYFVTREQAKYEIIKDGDVIMVDASEDLISVNKSVELSGIGSKKYIAGLHTFLLRDNNSVLVNGYRGAILNSKLIKSQLVRLAVGMKVFGVSKTQLKTVQIPVPTKSEQTAIATALSDADALISSLEKLIEKKRNIKQGAMQQLLKPKKGWDKKSIKEIVQTPVTDGPHETPVFYAMGIPFLSVNNLVDKKIDFTDLRYISVEDHLIYSKKCKPQRNDILLGKAASVGKVAIVETDLEFNIWSPIAMIRVKSDYSSKYVYYYLQTEDIVKQIDFFTNSSSQGNIGMGDIEKIEIPLPKTLAEQKEIATILSDMDNEISSLEKKLSKSKMLKQGMMQELLTGKIRLV